MFKRLFLILISVLSFGLPAIAADGTDEMPAPVLMTRDELEVFIREHSPLPERTLAILNEAFPKAAPRVVGGLIVTQQTHALARLLQPLPSMGDEEADRKARGDQAKAIAMAHQAIEHLKFLVEVHPEDPEDEMPMLVRYRLFLDTPFKDGALDAINRKIWESRLVKYYEKRAYHAMYREAMALKASGRPDWLPSGLRAINVRKAPWPGVWSPEKFTLQEPDQGERVSEEAEILRRYFFVAHERAVQQLVEDLMVMYLNQAGPNPWLYPHVLSLIYRQNRGPAIQPRIFEWCVTHAATKSDYFNLIDVELWDATFLRFRQYMDRDELDPTTQSEYLVDPEYDRLPNELVQIMRGMRGAKIPIKEALREWVWKFSTHSGAKAFGFYTLALAIDEIQQTIELAPDELDAIYELSRSAYQAIKRDHLTTTWGPSLLGRYYDVVRRALVMREGWFPPTVEQIKMLVPLAANPQADYWYRNSAKWLLEIILPQMLQESIDLFGKGGGEVSVERSLLKDHMLHCAVAIALAHDRVSQLAEGDQPKQPK